MSINNNLNILNKEVLEGKKSDTGTSEITSCANPLTSFQQLQGLELLNETDKLFIIKRKDQFPYNLGLPTRSHFQIYSSEGRHLFSACQTDPVLRERKFVMYVYNVTIPIVQEPFLKILQRCPERPEELDKAEILPYKKVDEELTQLNARRKESKLMKNRNYREARAHIHIRHVDQDFVGHIWRGKTEFRIYNTNLQHLFTFPKVASVSHSGQGSQRRRRLSLFSNKWTFYDYYPSGSTEPFLPQMPLGRVQLNADPAAAGINADSRDCCSASYPNEFSNVEKCLVLSFALSMYCRTKSTSEHVHQRCLFLILGVTTFAVLAILIIGTVCELTDHSKCKVFEI